MNQKKPHRISTEFPWKSRPTLPDSNDLDIFLFAFSFSTLCSSIGIVIIAWLAVQYSKGLTWFASGTKQLKRTTRTSKDMLSWFCFFRFCFRLCCDSGESEKMNQEWRNSRFLAKALESRSVEKYAWTKFGTLFSNFSTPSLVVYAQCVDGAVSQLRPGSCVEFEENHLFEVISTRCTVWMTVWWWGNIENN